MYTQQQQGQGQYPQPQQQGQYPQQQWQGQYPAPQQQGQYPQQQGPFSQPLQQWQYPPVSKSDSILNFLAERSLEVYTYESAGFPQASMYPTSPHTRQMWFRKGNMPNYIHLSFNSSFGFFAEIDLFSQNNEIQIERGRYLRWPLCYNLGPHFSSGWNHTTEVNVKMFNYYVMLCIQRLFTPPTALRGEIVYNAGEDILTLRSNNRFPYPASIKMRVPQDMKNFLLDLINQ